MQLDIQLIVSEPLALPKTDLAHCNLLAVSNKFGLVVFGTSGGFAVASCENVWELAQASEGKKVALSAAKEFPIAGGSVGQIRFCCTNETLVVGLNTGVILLYKTAELGEAKGVPPRTLQASIKGPISILPNPETHPDVCAVKDHNGAIFLLTLSTGEFKLLAKSGFASLCWSRKGKQLAVGDKLGVIRQVSLEGIIKNVISPPSVFDEARSEVTHISWLEDKTFVVVYKRGDQSQTYVITQTGSAAAGGITEYVRIENSHPRDISTHGWHGISSALIQMDSTETLLVCGNILNADIAFIVQNKGSSNSWKRGKFCYLPLNQSNKLVGLDLFTVDRTETKKCFLLFALTSTGGLLVYDMKDSSSTEYETLGAETITKPTASMPPTGMLLEFDIVEIEWTCKSCLVRNLDKATECICCGWSKADLDPSVTSPSNETSFDGFDSKPLPFAPRGTNFSAVQSLANSKHFKPKSRVSINPFRAEGYVSPDFPSYFLTYIPGILLLEPREQKFISAQTAFQDMMRFDDPDLSVQENDALRKKYILTDGDVLTDDTGACYRVDQGMALVSTPEAIVWVPCSDIAAVSRDGRLWHPTMLKTTTPTATSDLSGKGKERAVEPIVVTKEPKGGVEPVCIQNEINALKKDSADPIACFPASSLPIPVIYELVDCVFKVDICSAVKLFESCSLFRKYGFKILAKRLLSHLPNGIHDVEVTLSKEHLEYFRQIPQSFELEWKVGSVITKILNAYFHVYDSFYKTFEEVSKIDRKQFHSAYKTFEGESIKIVSWSQLAYFSAEFDSKAKGIRETNPAIDKHGETLHILMPLDCALLFRWLSPNLEKLQEYGFFDNFQPLNEGRFSLNDFFEIMPEHPEILDYIGVWYPNSENPKKEAFINFGYNFGDMIYTRLYVNTSPGGNALSTTYGVVSDVDAYEGWTGLNQCGQFESITSMLLDLLKHAEDPSYGDDNENGWPHTPFRNSLF